MIEFDKGPSPSFARLFAEMPDYSPFKEHFWFDWGPVFYRGRLNGSARVLCVASDPGPTERLVCRTLVGDAGQRVQGFLSKLGLTRSYVCLNAFAYALFPGSFNEGNEMVKDPAITQWRNRVFDRATSKKLQAIVAFGSLAQKAVELWEGKGDVPVCKVYHPSFRDTQPLLDSWRTAITQLRGIVTPDPDGDSAGPNYGVDFQEADYSPIPRRDLPFGYPDWIGNDQWGRTAVPRHNNCVSRPDPDDRHTLIWIAPTSE